MTYNIELCMKVSEKRWIESLRNGKECFNPVETFITKAETGGNNEQGDKYEGIFARMCCYAENHLEKCLYSVLMELEETN